VPSYFEILTGVAYRWFADVAVEAAVVEVGSGDAGPTNIADGRVAVITNVSIDTPSSSAAPDSISPGEGRNRQAGSTLVS